MNKEQEILLRCGILEEYWDKSFEDFYGHPKMREQLEPKVISWNEKYGDKHPINLDFDYGKKVYDEVVEYANNLSNARKNGISLFLWGNFGTGKTLLAVCVLKEAIKQGFTAQMTSLGGIIEVYAEGWSNPSQKENFNRRVKNVDFLLIDDVGKEYRAKNNDLVEVAFDNLIRYRVFRRKPCILTTNTDISKVQTVYGQSLASLLYGKCINVEVKGGDYRKLIQAKDTRRLLKEG